MTGEPETDETAADQPFDGGAGLRSAEPESRRVDRASLVAGLVFIAIALAAFTDRYWADLDLVLVAGGAVVAVGAAMIAATVLRHSRRNGAPGSEPRRDR
ncbi:MAG: hypothetical protein J4F50_11480 [Acidimicrobiia bacterium]|nr:hypothetical protein [Acidimicrobiia bacterium]